MKRLAKGKITNLGVRLVADSTEWVLIHHPLYRSLDQIFGATGEAESGSRRRLGVGFVFLPGWRFILEVSIWKTEELR